MRTRLLFFAFLVLGTIVRLLYALKFQLFNQAPDQITSELILNELLHSGDWTYSKIIHYDHEGGSILASLLALLFKPVLGFKSLVGVAFVLDFICRGVQLWVVNRLFGFKAFLAFGAWTIFSIPLIIPWAGLSFGLHSVASVFPFAFLFLIARNHSKPQHYVFDALFLGFAFWFHYSNLVLVPCYLFYLLYSNASLKSWTTATGTLIFIAFLHVFVRMNFSAGFDLAGVDLGAIRGESFDFLNPELYSRLLEVYTHHLPQVFYFNDIGPISKYWLGLCWVLTCGIGLVLLLVKGSKPIMRVASYGLGVAVLYLAMYAMSPFYLEWPDYAHYLNARHFTYIIPLIVALAMAGFVQSKNAFRWVIAPALMLVLLLSCASYFNSYFQVPKKAHATRAVGWVLANKFGHNPELIQKINANHPYSQNEIWIGVGWGTTSHLLVGLNDSNFASENGMNQINRLTALKEMYGENKLLIDSGIRFAFSPELTPTLDSALFNRINLD